MKSELIKAIPQLPSLDFNKSKEFYMTKLGFELLGEHEDLLILKKDQVELHLWLCDNKLIPGNSSCYMYISNIDELFGAYNKQGIIDPEDALEDKEWGMREFYVIDDSGNLLKFGQKIGQEVTS
jgi:hypothetical protein